MKPLTTIDYADKYINTKLNAEVWQEMDIAKRENVLIEATRRIYAIHGFKYTPEVIELLSVIPDDLQQACCEVALALTNVNENDPHVINQSLGIKSISFGQDSASYDENAYNACMPNYLFNQYAQSILNKYILKGCKYV
jgi:hypothetical protein